MINFELSVISILLAGYALWIFGMFAAAMVRGSRSRRNQRETAELAPQVQRALVDYLAGADNADRIQEFARHNPSAAADAFVAFRATVTGEARDRLCELALEQGLVYSWCQETRSGSIPRRRAAFVRLGFACYYEPCRRVAGEVLIRGLADPDHEVRLEACRALVQAGEPSDIESVFESALSHNLLIRILLTEELRRHAGLLCERAVPEALQSPDPARVLAVLDMLVAWERALPLRGLFGLLNREHPRIRIEALRLAALVEMTAEDKAAVLEALEDRDERVALAAAQTAGRLRLESALIPLACCLRNGGPELARAAACALAELPGHGRETLQQLSSNPDAATAAAAREALERVPQGGRF